MFRVPPLSDLRSDTEQVYFPSGETFVRCSYCVPRRDVSFTRSLSTFEERPESVGHQGGTETLDVRHESLCRRRPLVGGTDRRISFVLGPASFVYPSESVPEQGVLGLRRRRGRNCVLEVQRSTRPQKGYLESKPTPLNKVETELRPGS